MAASLADVREDTGVLIGEDKKDPVKFRIVARSEMGLARRAGKKPGFARAIINSVEAFYGDILQNLAAYQPKAPQLREKAPEVASEPLPTVELLETTPAAQTGVADALQRWSVDW